MAQNYGLGFYGNDADQGKRTSLDISTESGLCFKDNFELSFDVAFLPNTSDYFGYIFRIITSDNQNIDLIYNRASKGKHFNVIIGNKFSKLMFDIPDNKLISDWTRVSIKFNVKNNKLSINSNGTVLEEPFKLISGGCYKILFGTNDYQKFKAVDVPPMKIRDVRINEGGKLAYCWPLNDNAGNTAQETVHNKAATITNPLWIKNRHSEWKLLKTFVLKGAGSAAFDPQKELVYFVGADTIMRYYVQTGLFNGIRSASKLGKTDLGNQSIFDTNSKKIYNVFPEERIFAFDVDKLAWSKNDNNIPTRNYSHFNKFYFPADSSIYILGGYGHYLYKNQVINYHIPSGKWREVQNKGDYFIPRHLAGLGTTDKGAYILGGYGSLVGQQAVNPTNLYDLVFFNAKTKTFKKIYELKHSAEDFVFANSLIIDEHKKTYYGAIFDKNKASSSLQLIAGSLTKPVYDSVGNALPYPLLKDIHSFSDLYYCKLSNEFVMVTLFNDEKLGVTNYYVYSLYASPIQADAKPIAGHHHIARYLLLALGLALLGFIGYKKFKPKGSPVSAHHTAEKEGYAIQHVINENEAPATTAKTEDTGQKPAGVIYLFGGLQVYDTEGNDLTKLLTPLLKEIFLAVLLYTIKWKRGISTEKLNELFWFDKSGESANNNRSVNIAKLKQFLDKLGHATITKDSDYWKISIDYDYIQVDYKQYLDIVKDKKPTRQKISDLAKIIYKGSFLANTGYEWIDNFKLETANEIIDAYLYYANSINIADDAEFSIELANYIFYFDPVNEEAMQIKCKALVHLGKHSLAKYAFENFCQEYRAIYKENFSKDFHTILE